MSRNAEVVRAAFESWNRGDWEGSLRETAEDIVIDNSMVEGEYRGVHHGREEAVRMFERFAEPWDSVVVEPTQVIDAGERVFAEVRGRFEGRDGIQADTRTGMCFTFVDGLVTHIYMPNDVDSAREAAGLPLE